MSQSRLIWVGHFHRKNDPMTFCERKEGVSIDLEPTMLSKTFLSLLDSSESESVTYTIVKEKSPL